MICANAPDLRRIWQNVAIDNLTLSTAANIGIADGESAAATIKKIMSINDGLGPGIKSRR